MSASSKKKLRNEQNAARLTERQLAEQKEAKKVKLYTIAFVAALAMLLVVAIVFGVNNVIANSGMRERNTVAMTVDGEEISNAEMNYYFIDAVNNFFSGNNSYLVQLGLLDVTQPLDQQTNPMTGQLWSEYLLEYAAESLKSNYALVKAAREAGFTLSEAELADVDSIISNFDVYATLYGHTDSEAYLKTMYGHGAEMDTYREYITNSMLAQSYYNAYAQELTFSDAEYQAADAEDPNYYSSYTYDYYYLPASKFLTGGTTDEEGNTTYSDEEIEASVKAAEEAAKSLTDPETITSTEELDKAIAALSINADAEVPPTSTRYSNTLYSNIGSSAIALWVSQPDRQPGDLACLPNEASTTDEETGESATTINGYYVILFQEANDNTFALKNVRHSLAAFQGGTTDPTTGTITYSDDEKAAAKALAESMLEQWKSGEATEESFAALANELSDDGDGTTGGLYEDVYPGQMVSAFEDWCYAENRKAGDTGIVETQYGYHVMYFVGDSDITYRTHMIDNDLRTEAVEAWYTELMESIAVTQGDVSYVNTNLVLNAGM